MKKLKKYNEKRNFDVTSEPKGKGTCETEQSLNEQREKNIFVVQFHRARRDHYDFRLEWRGVLLSWAVPKGPSFNPKDKRLAVHVEDHPLEYANFEGMIPKGEYGGGSVMLWDSGTWETVGDFSKGLKAGEIKFKLFGKRLFGQWALVRLKDEKNWLLIKDRDEFAKDEDGISAFQTSVKSGKTSKQIENDLCKKNPFQETTVMLAKLTDTVPKGKEWLFEVKYDGFRIVAFLENGKAKLVTRNGKDYTLKFPEIVKSLQTHFGERAAVLDGEVIAVDEEGKSDFQALQNHLKFSSDIQIVYMVFDLLSFDGQDLRSQPLIERKKRLEDVLRKAPYQVSYCQHVEGHGKECFEAAKKMGFEGNVCKDKTSKYIGGRGETWLKLKCFKRQEFVVGGYTKTDKNHDGFSALLLGIYEKEKLIFCGRVGTGFNALQKRDLMLTFEKLKSKKMPFEREMKAEKNEEIFWLKPHLVVEVQFAEMTKEGLLRQASFKGLREDKRAEDVIFERTENVEKDEEILQGYAKLDENVLEDVSNEIETTLVDAENKFKNSKNGIKNKKNTKKIDKNAKNMVAGVKISSPNRMVYADKKITKMDVVKYYEAISKRMLPLIEGRILSVVRCHKDASFGGFFKKHPLAKIDGIEIVKLKNDKGKESDYFYISSLAGLVGQVQLGTVEFHVWGSDFAKLEQPNYMVFDLDPDEGMDIQKIRQGVRDLKKILDELNLKSFLKTSGGKGYHIVVPFKAGGNWKVFHDFAENVAKLMESKWPKRYTTNIRKENRKGKIFVDFMRNTRGATSVAPYSLRARKGAKVSMPIAWSELNKVEPDGVDIFAALKRMKKTDPWKDFFKVSQTLN